MQIIKVSSLLMPPHRSNASRSCWHREFLQLGYRLWWLEIVLCVPNATQNNGLHGLLTSEWLIHMQLGQRPAFGTFQGTRGFAGQTRRIHIA